MSSSRDGGVIVSQISPGGSRWRPLRCESASRIVRPTGASGIWVRSGSSRERTIASRNARMHTAVKVFVIEPIR